MREWLRDLYSHQAWADAEHWRAFDAHQAALADGVLRQRQHHVHLVQRAFLSLARGEAVVVTRPEDFATADALKDYAREYHARAAAFLDSVSEARLAEPLQVPWFRDPPIRLTVAQGLLQAAMHSQHHRGQNAARLRDLGGEPPPIDFIVWLWKDKPAPRWEREPLSAPPGS